MRVTPPTSAAAGRALSAARLLLRLRGAPEPQPLYDQLRALGPVVAVPWLRSLLVTGHAECRRALRDPVFALPDAGWRDPVFALPDAGWRDRRVPGWRGHQSVVDLNNGLLTLNPPRRTAVRGALAASASRQAVDELRPRIAEFTEQCLDDVARVLRHDGTADLVALLADPLPARAVCAWLDLPVADAPRLAALTRRHACLHELSPTQAQLRDADSAAEEFKDYFLPLIGQRAHRPGADALSRLVGGSGGRAAGLTSYDVAVNAATLFVAGFETTATMITSLARAVIEEPGFADRLRAAPEHVPAAVEEIIRRNPSAAVVSRVATRDCRLGGATVPKDQLLHLLLPAANRDPAAAGQPHLSFGAGIHYCLGARLARLELTTLLPRLLDRLPRMRLAAPPAAPRGLVLPHPPRLLVTADQPLSKAPPR
ncbi:cytochrome P450 [Streptomyces sp. 8K308]|uniref:cytochrome P450 n=1 Tax=Streptomyces sp. 8K308 TaxID=2530388 RepID=UPI00104E40E5|nr:cytochrome P450 [Streptomyces sp. 8K308]TDC22125.1 cytochrome P450 [Streptomyces sp. 8K308]